MASYLSSPDVLKICLDIIIRHLDNSINEEGSIWYNEYGRIDRDDELSKKLVRYTSTDDFRLVTMINTDCTALFFKILPAKKKTPFSGIQTTMNWDGYFVDMNATIKPELIQLLNQSCVGKTTEMVNGWGMDSEENVVWLAPRLEMYLA